MPALHQGKLGQCETEAASPRAPNSWGGRLKGALPAVFPSAPFFGAVLVIAPPSALAAADDRYPLLMPLFLFLFSVLCGVTAALLFTAFCPRTFRYLHALLSTMPVAVALVRKRDGYLVYGNKPCRDLLGVRRLHGRYLMPDTLSAVMVHDYLRPFADQAFFDDSGVELPVANGQQLNLRISGRVITYLWSPCWLLYITPDLSSTDSHQQFEKEQRTFQQVLNSLSELVCFQNNSGELIGTNKAFDRFWRGRLEEGIACATEGNARTKAANHSWTVTPEGSSCLLEINRNLLLGDNGEVIGSLSISHDVTEWHEMQDVLRSEIEKREITEQELAQRNNLLDTILHASRDPIGLYNEHGIYVGCNEAFARTLGHTTETLLGKAVRDVLEPERFAEVWKIDLKVMEEGISVTTDDCVTLTDGSMVWFEVLKSPYRDPTDGTLGVLMMARDVTERRLAEQQLADAIMELQELSFVDSLTKVANRRSFDEQLRKLWYSHIREQQPLTLILCDIDYFKAFNDNYGHQQGDFALREVAKVLLSVIKRETDEVARYGGEEFAFLLPNTNLNGGKVVAEAIHKALAEKGLTHMYSEVSNSLTVSLGVATIIPQPNQDYGELVEMADIALYQAKGAGRNCTMTMTDSQCDDGRA